MNLEAFESFNAAKSAQAKALLCRALQGQLPPGYVLLDDPNQMYGGALLRVKPSSPKAGDLSIHFSHRLNCRHVQNGDTSGYVPSKEFVLAYFDRYVGPTLVKAETALGADGLISTEVLCNELPAAVAGLLSNLFAIEPFIILEWRTCEHDKQKKELFCTGWLTKKLQSIWKFKNTWGTYSGNSFGTMQLAMRQAEADARLILRSAQSERLSRLF
jgi:hypothetical protein